ncbi:excalibur calcium-binding domain-containing protein [Psychrobacillus sp. OK032]|uniref:excalibur calcium-binding domain-containing protein n=1 Tax=Psychrobacillus sp. OK032 TaxID=1884358 RepID=UPI0008C90737|nr:excalibur calcium-binding domain-containing protein [Psychrobacillus sp. OK032]SES34665.1 Excalibur calcium-binding domain-containing protein [Psychrobacillus sp. OK032]
MFSKYIKLVMVAVIALGISIYKLDTANAAGVMWGKTELKLGQIGKVTILADTVLSKLESDGSLSTVRTMKKGEEYRVYSYQSNQGGLYGVGGGNFVQKSAIVKYETPSKSKLALLNEISENPKQVQQPTQQVAGNGLEVIPGAPTSFRNCKEMNEYYTNGVKKGHPAYKSKHDRDNDDWACER